MMSESNINSAAEVSSSNQDEIGRSPLHHATITCSLETVRDLLKNGVNPNVQDLSGRTPLICAVKKNNLDIVMALLDNHADPNIQNKFGNTSLHFAAKRYFCDLKIVAALLEKNANVNMRNFSGVTPLHYATIRGNLEIMSTLLKSQADPNIQHKYNRWTPLYYAIKYCNLKAVLLLLKNNANVNIEDSNSRAPFHNVIRHKANVNIRNDKGETPLHYAIENRTIISNSLSSVNNVYLTVKFHQNKKLLVDRVRLDWLLNIKALLQNSANVNIRNHKGQTPLHYAAIDENEDIVKALLDNNADINIQDIRGHTALHRCNHLLQHLLKEHVIKLKVAKLHVCKENLDLVYNPTFECELVGVEEIESLCHQELIEMKYEGIGDNSISFYKFMVVDFHTRVNYLNNESMIQVLKLVDWKVKFPLYANILQSRFTEAFKRSELLRKARLYGGFSIFQRLPDICINRIYSLLSNDELETLIHVSMIATSSE